MPPEVPFSLDVWLSQQDVSDIDSELPEMSARLLVMHRLLVTESRDALTLAEDVCSDSSSVSFLAEQTDSEEPRLPLMCLTDLLGVLRMQESPLNAETEIRVASSMPRIMEVLIGQSRTDDSCPDAQTYALTLACFLLQRISGAEFERLCAAAATPAFLRSVMRIWRIPEIARHVAWAPDPAAGPGAVGGTIFDNCEGLGSLVTAFLEQLMASTFATGACAYGIVKLDSWATTFFTVRFYADDISSMERARLCRVLFHVVETDTEFAEKVIFDSEPLVRAIMDSAALVSSARRPPRTHSNEGDAGDVGEVESVDSNDGISDMSVTNADVSAALRATALGAAVFDHVRLVQFAVRRGGQLEARRVRRFFRCAALRVWFWDSLWLCAEAAYSLVGYELALGEVCSAESVRMPCLRSALAHIAWAAAVWLAKDNISWKSSPNETLERREILNRIQDLAEFINQFSISPVLTASTVRLSRKLLWRMVEPEKNQEHEARDRALYVCEWCMASDLYSDDPLKSCARCGTAHFCNQDHMRTSWKRNHRLWCSKKIPSVLAAESIITEEDGSLRDACRGCSLGESFSKHGMETLVRMHGSVFCRVGAGLELTETNSGSFECRAISRGQLAKRVLEKVRRTPKALDVCTSMMETCAEYTGAVLMAAVFYQNTPVTKQDGSESVARKVRVGLYRVFKTTRSTEARGRPMSNCLSPGCTDHDSACAALLSKLV